jgi:hypothetical protein
MSEAEENGSAGSTRLYIKQLPNPLFLENPVVVLVFLSKEKSQYAALGKILTFLE